MNAVPRSSPSWRIVRKPNVCGNEPSVEGTRIPVTAIVNLWLFYQDLDRVLSAFPRLDQDAIRCALDYYAENQEEIDHLIAERERAAYAAQ